jgi:hypothetical protein
MSSQRPIVAVLTFDSRYARPVHGVRSLHTSSRQLIYSAHDTELDLRISVQHDECLLAGQVMRDDCTGGAIEIWNQERSAEVSLNELCEFMFPAIPVGNYSLRVRLPQLEIEIPKLELKD